MDTAKLVILKQTYLEWVPISVLWHLLNEIELFLGTCTYDEICKFWNAIDNLRQYFQNFQKRTQQAEVPNFLNHRRQKRDFYRILEVVTDLSYPKMHLSNYLE